MCQWASAIVTRIKRVLFNFWTDSHEDLIALFGLDDRKLLGKFCSSRVFASQSIAVARPFNLSAARR